MKIAFYTLGCKVNQYESQAMAEAMALEGFTVVQDDAPADVYVINSCTVTAESDRKTRQAVRRFKRRAPQSVVVLTGCVPQAYPEIAETLPEADIILGNRNNQKLAQAVRDYFNCGRQVQITQHKTGDAFEGGAISDFRERTRAIIKIEDGCNRFCSYCIIPYARGRVRSKPLEEIRQEAQRLADAGFQELVLVGINLSAYGQDCGLHFWEAVEAAAEPAGILRVRLGSLEPDHLTDEVIDNLAKCKKLCPQFHISLQSGCTKTLKAMNRHYDAEEYDALCQKLRRTFPDTSLTTDIMVGFAGETDEDFSESLAFARHIGFEKIHVFPYSPRVGTRAAEFPDQVDPTVKDARAHAMLAAAQEIRSEFLKSQVGKIMEVLPEEHSKDGFCHGYTANYTPVRFKGDFSPALCCVKITDADDDSCVGELVK